MDGKILIERVSINQIKPAAYNPRRMSDEEMAKLKKSIDEFDYVDPLVWNKQTGNLVGGHQRFKVLKEKGVLEIDVSVVDLPLEKEKALNLALNKISGDWEEKKLAELLKELNEAPEFEIGLTGFREDEVSKLFDRVFESEDGNEDGFDAEKFAESIENPVTKLGDLIELGEHRILCGDSSKPEDIDKLLSGKSINLVHTDPPYSVDYYGGNRPHANGRPKNCRRWDRIYCDNLPQSEYEAWLNGILRLITSKMSPGAAIYCWNGHRQFGPMHEMMTTLNIHISCVLTWVKERFAISYGDYNQQSEFCIYGWKNDGEAHKWYGPTNESTVWEVERDLTRCYIHPTQKPIALAQRAIRNSSQRGEIIFDAFLGSGSTLIAAESLERRCFGVELDPRYVDGIVRRYIQYKGKEKISPEIVEKYKGGDSNE